MSEEVFYLSEDSLESVESLESVDSLELLESNETENVVFFYTGTMTLCLLTIPLIIIYDLLT